MLRAGSVFPQPLLFGGRMSTCATGRLRVRAKGQAHRHSCLIETALHRRAACLRTTGFSMEDV
jgi:hypothetical protein